MSTLGFTCVLDIVMWPRSTLNIALWVNLKMVPFPKLNNKLIKPNVATNIIGEGHGAVVKAVRKVRDLGFVHRSGIQSFKETKCSLVKKSFLWGTSVTERFHARPQSARVRISNPVPGGQCYQPYSFNPSFIYSFTTNIDRYLLTTVSLCRLMHH